MLSEEVFESLVVEVYLYIGITSSYLYSSGWVQIFHDGIFHKKVP